MQLGISTFFNYAESNRARTCLFVPVIVAASLSLCSCSNGALPTTPTIRLLLRDERRSFSTKTICRTQFPLACVKQGGVSRLKFGLQCTKDNRRISCGTVRWKVRTSAKQLTAAFSPNPGNPSRETIAASASLKIGDYTQTVLTTCTICPNKLVTMLPIVVR
ncbi:MAG: hypothetical protein JO302_06130 [Candidatus Eremiobacteraeota bacterium]|nr:hypothetical protein [Candidatus Eremiobacteraeota bacterium]